MAVQPTTIIIFGATGDLARQKLFPALVSLCERGELPEPFSCVAIGRRPFTNLEFTNYIATTNNALFKGEHWEQLAANIRYFQLDFLEIDHYQGLNHFLQEIEQGSVANRLMYLAVPPNSYKGILHNLAESGLRNVAEGAWLRVVLEKPFGHDLVSAQELNREIAECFTEEQLYRVDHYLGKETVQNILAFRFANGIFEPLWNNEHVDHIQITVAENEGIGTRGNYYDQAGAFRDMVQNHLLQLVAFLTMEEPDSFIQADLAKQKQMIFNQLTFDSTRTLFGQYAGYRQEAQINPESTTETFAMTKLELSTARWQGTPIYLRTGKKMAIRISEISVVFKQSDQRLFHNKKDKQPNILTFRIQPDEGIALQLDVKTPGENMLVQSVNMEFCYSMTFKMKLPDAYERVFMDILKGDFTLALHPGPIEQSWQLIDAILAKKESCFFEPYAEGTWGPSKADQLMLEDNRRWLAHESQVCNGVLLAD